MIQDKLALKEAKERRFDILHHHLLTKDTFNIWIFYMNPFKYVSKHEMNLVVFFMLQFGNFVFVYVCDLVFRMNLGEKSFISNTFLMMVFHRVIFN